MTHTASIMVVDDDEDIREAMRDLLESSGYAVTTAANGLEALAQLRAGANPAVILLDLMMPVMDGYQFVAEQRKSVALAAIPVLVITADGHAHQKAATLGAQGHVQKPFTAEALLHSVEPFC